MKDITKRRVLFIFGCIFLRAMLVIIAKYIPLRYLHYMGYLGLVPSIGFLVIYLFGLRKTGGEVFGNKIWWNKLRPIHAMLYIVFSILAIKKNKKAYIPLLIDVNMGLSAFMMYHLNLVNF